ncbi:MAG: glycoside hydrolase family 31 protein [Clostridia bacterium]|nr:glycoside hydrolase family 31 protein [Clostridia bacterium]
MSIQSLQFKDGKELVFRTKDLLCRLTFTGNHAWRLQTALDGDVFDDFGAGQTLARDLGETPFLCKEPLSFSEDGAGLCSLTAPDGSRAVLCGTPFSLRFYSPEGQEGASFYRIAERYRHTRSVYGRLTADERVYGTGERFDRLNQRGWERNIYARDEWAQWKGNSYVPIPVMVSSRGYGLFMNRFEFSVFDIDSTNDGTFMLTVRDEAPLDLYIFATDKMADVLYGYSVLTGFAPQPADWVYGTQVCRYAPDFSTVDGVLAMEKAMEENGFPWDAVILEGWDTDDPDKIAELKKLCDRLHAKGKHVMVYQACGMIPSNAAERYGMKPEYMLRKASDLSPDLEEVVSYNPADNPGKGRHRYLDITNPEALDWWLGTVWGKLLNECGVEGCKIDFCELLPDNEPLLFADGRKTPGAHHWYPTMYNTIMFREYSKQPHGGMNLSRGGGIGAQRYPVIWAGDQTREWFFLKVAIRAVLSAGLSGLPFFTYDMAAYRPGFDPETDPEPEVFARGTEYTCFMLNIQTHGTVSRPYDFDEYTREIYRIYSNMHDALRPYLVEQGKISCKTALPLVRALPLWDASDPVCLDCEDEFMLGDAFLVAPVLDRVDKRDVYLPAGTWRDIYSGRIYDGKQTLADYRAPLCKLPLFVNENSASAALPAVLKAIDPFIRKIEAMSK